MCYARLLLLLVVYLVSRGVSVLVLAVRQRPFLSLFVAR